MEAIVQKVKDVFRRRDAEGMAFLLLAAAVFCSAFSLPAGRSVLVLSAVAMAVFLAKARQRPVCPAVGWLVLLFLAAAAFSTAVGVDAGLGFSKLHKILWLFLALGVAATAVNTPGRLADVLRAYAAGTGVLAIRMMIENPIAAARGPDFMSALVSKGSMTYAQVLMLGGVISLGFLFAAMRRQGRTIGWWILLALQVAALGLMFKRGSWVCAAVLAGVLVALYTRWRVVLILVVAVVGLALVLPPVRARLAATSKEFSVNSGGRMTMWFKVAPVLITEHPLGIGWRTLTEERMAEAAAKAGVKVERNRTHLHSNVAEVLVETGWMGFALWLLWMGKGLADAGVFLRRAGGALTEEGMTGIVLLLMLAGLFANGLVEYNFGDGELMLAYGWVMGAAAAGRRRFQRVSGDNP